MHASESLEQRSLSAESPFMDSNYARERVDLARALELPSAVPGWRRWTPFEAAARLPGREREEAAGLLSRYPDDLRA